MQLKLYMLSCQILILSILFSDSFIMVIGNRLAKCALLSLLEVTFQLAIQNRFVSNQPCADLMSGKSIFIINNLANLALVTYYIPDLELIWNKFEFHLHFTNWSNRVIQTQIHNQNICFYRCLFSRQDILKCFLYQFYKFSNIFN